MQANRLPDGRIAHNSGGRVYRAVRYCLIAAAPNPVEIGELLDYCYPHAQTHPLWHRDNVHRCLPRYAVLVGRDGTRPGRPGLWAPNEQLRRLIDCS